MLYSSLALTFMLLLQQGFAEETMKRDSYNQCMMATNNCATLANGVCRDFSGRGDYSCVCQTGWTGSNCDVSSQQTRELDNLIETLQRRDSYNQCMFATKNCETLANGDCMDFSGRGDYSCVCKTGWTGSRCDQVAVQTRSLEYLMGTLEKRDSYNQCMMATNNCATLANGVCRDFSGRGDYSCVCQTGWSGSNCDVQTQKRDLDVLKQAFSKRDSFNQCMTATNQCGHLANGICVDMAGRGDYSCVCKEGWKGSNCDVEERALDTYLRSLLDLLANDEK